MKQHTYRVICDMSFSNRPERLINDFLKERGGHKKLISYQKEIEGLDVKRLQKYNIFSVLTILRAGKEYKGIINTYKKA